MKKDLGGIASVKVSFLMQLRMSCFTQNGMELLALQHRKNDLNDSIQDSHSRCKILAVLKARYTVELQYILDTTKKGKRLESQSVIVELRTT